MDLSAWVALRRWEGILDLVDQLPPTARLWEAQANDPEFVESVVASQAFSGSSADEGRPRGPRLTEYSTEAALLSQILDAVRVASHVNARLHGQKPPPPKPTPRPETELDRARERVAEAEVDAVAAAFGFAK